MRIVWVGFYRGLIDRIFKNRKAAFANNAPDDGRAYEIIEIPYGEAVSAIRHRLWTRCSGFCELCGSTVTEESGQMHEQKHRGKGGEVSMDNSVFVCARTHAREHRSRAPRWSRKPLTGVPKV